MAEPTGSHEDRTTIEPRAMVPTQRETTAATEERHINMRSVAPQPAGKRWTRTQVRDRLKDLDPRDITGGAPRIPLFVMALSALVVGWDMQALGILLPEMRADFAFDLGFLFTLATVLGTITLVVSPLMGYLADRLKRVWMLRIGAVVANASTIGMGIAGGIPQLVMSRIGMGLGGSVSQPAGFPLLTDIYPSRTRSRVFAFLGVAGQLGAISGAFLAGFVGQAYGWRATVILFGAIATIVSLGTFLIKEPARGFQDKIEQGLSAEEASDEQPPVGWAEAWRAARSITTIRRLWYATPFLHAAGAGTLLLLGVYYAEVFGLDVKTRGTIVAFGGLVGLIGLILSGPVSDRILSERPGLFMSIMGLLLVVQSLAVVGLAISPNYIVSVIITIPVTFTSALFAPALFTLVSLTVPARIRGLGMQTIAPWQLLGMALIAILGTLANHLGIRPALLIFSPLYLVAAVILGTSGSGVERDINAARLAAVADEESRKAKLSGSAKMIVCRGVDVHYDGVQVLFGVDLDVEEGEIVALLGTNGAGKSTLLRAIAGIQEASNGAIFLGGRDITHAPAYKNASDGVVMLPGGRAIFPSLTVAENLRAAGWLKESEQPLGDRIYRVLEYFPVLRERMDQQAGSLSGGEQQMLALGQSFLMRPRLLMIDELTLGLAPSVVARLLEILREIRKLGTTIIVVEQSGNVALTIAERAVFMEKGEVRFVGGTAELLQRPDVMRSVFLSGAAGGPGSSERASARASAETSVLSLEVSDLSVSYGGIAAVTDVSISLAQGEIVGIIGPNGAGKTTLFDAISGVAQASSGMVLVEGNDVTRLSPDARARVGLGRSFQSAKLFPSMTAREAIAVAFEQELDKESMLASAFWSPSVRRAERRTYRKVDDLIKILGLDAYQNKFVGELSTATRRIVDIACIMASAPKVLLLDEPSSGLAQAETEQLGPVLRRLVRQTGCGILIIEHDIPLVTSLSHRLVAMVLGRVVAQGLPNDVVNDPQVVSSYMGTSMSVITRSGEPAGVPSMKR
ncbi:MAG: MFS transporter [Actinomycetota bacterium]|nr:MFS transporter [Actinomycetota bacterium]